jgi:hypothetical protein
VSWDSEEEAISSPAMRESAGSPDTRDRRWGSGAPGEDANEPGHGLRPSALPEVGGGFHEVEDLTLGRDDGARLPSRPSVRPHRWGFGRGHARLQFILGLSCNPQARLDSFAAPSEMANICAFLPLPGPLGNACFGSSPPV